MDNPATSETIIDVRQTLPRTRHPLIFDTFAGLKAEEDAPIVVNDVGRVRRIISRL